MTQLGRPVAARFVFAGTQAGIQSGEIFSDAADDAAIGRVVTVNLGG